MPMQSPRDARPTRNGGVGRKNMKHIHLLFVASALMVPAVDAGEPKGDALSQPFEWTHVAEVRVAFYESPPLRLSASFRTAVKDHCRKPVNVTTTPSWLCSSGAIYFVRAVDVLGNRSNTGFVCEGENNLRFSTPDMFGEESGCLAMCYDIKQKNHYIQVNPN
jgi:hypothetical protein